MNEIDSIINYLNKNKIKYEKDFLIKKISYIKIGGIVPLYIKPETIEIFIDLIKYLNINGLIYKVVGNISNCLFDDININKIFISTHNINKINFIDENTIEVESGVMLPKFVKMMAQKSITGFEGLVGIPGTIGGSLFMNAGAYYDNEISDHLISVNCLDINNNIVFIEKDKCDFSFRNSFFQKNPRNIILYSRFNLIYGNQDDIYKKIEYCQYHRKKYQESKYPNLGSLFKTKDIYLDMAKTDRIYKIFLWIYRMINRLFKNKDSKTLNYITCKYFKINFNDDKPFSDKTINCMVNRGNLNFKKAMDFICQMRNVLKNTVELEIEIVN